MKRCECIGWWQQSGLGRQSMDDLWLSVEDAILLGSGRDLIAPFTMEGLLRPDGCVEIVKQYEGAHRVLYVGHYDGEGTFYGTWDIQGFRGKWSIKFSGFPSFDADDIQDLEPPPNP